MTSQVTVGHKVKKLVSGYRDCRFNLRQCPYVVSLRKILCALLPSIQLPSE